MLYKTRTELAHVNVKLDEARSSLGLLWQSTKRMDEDQVARLALLADSIRSVLGYAQGEVRLWEASFANLQQRIDESGRGSTKELKSLSKRLDTFARADVAQRTRLEALERQDYMHSSAVEALSRRTQVQEANTHDVVSTVSALRETFGRADSELSQLEQRLAASSSAYGQLGRRVDNLAGFADGFRRAGLNGAEVSDQLSQLAGELRRIRMRVDSLRPMTRTVMSSDSR
jgi:DNA anti-recombination protein RmuC